MEWYENLLGILAVLCCINFVIVCPLTIVMMRAGDTADKRFSELISDRILPKINKKINYHVRSNAISKRT